MLNRGGLRPVSVAVAAVVAAVLGYAAQLYVASHSGGGPSPSWFTVAVLIVMAGGIVAAGLPIRRALRGDTPRRVNAIRAVRTLVLAQAAALTGGLVAGWYAGMLLALAPDAEIGSMRAAMTVAGALVAAGAVLCGAGFWVQAQCRIDPPDDPLGGGGGPGGAGAVGGPSGEPA